MKSKNKLYIDFDNTIVDSIQSVVSLYNEDFQYYKDFRWMCPYEINTYEFKECNCATKEQINHYFRTPRFFYILQFMPFAKEVIEKLKKYYEVVIVTMGNQENYIGKQLWVTKNLPDTKMICVNMKEYNDKSHIDMSDGIFIDDMSKNLITSNAKEKILFGDKYSWNEDWEGTRLYNWIEIENYLLKDGAEVKF
ncbi:hypothetical protein F140042L4_19630 [Coprococcus phoceensis]